MTRNTHHIKRIRAQVHFASPRDAVVCQARLPGIIQNSLAPVMDEIFTQIFEDRSLENLILEDQIVQDQVSKDRALADHRVVIDRLVINLGWLDPMNLEQDMVERFKAGLGKALGPAISRAVDQARNTDRDIRAAAHDLPFISGGRIRHLSFDLLAEKLLAAVTDGPRTDIAPVWDPMVTRHGSETKRWLMTHGRTPALRRQIARRFSTRQMKTLIQLFEPAHQGFMDFFLERPETLLPPGIRPHVSSTPFKHQVAEFILAYLFVDRGSRFNRRMFLSSVIRQMAGHYNIGVTDLLTSLTDLFQTPEDQSPLKQQILVFLLELAREDPDGPVPCRRGADRHPGVAAANALAAPYAAASRRYPPLFKGPNSPAGDPATDLIETLIRKTALECSPHETEFCRRLIENIDRRSGGPAARERLLDGLITRLILDPAKGRTHSLLLKALLAQSGHTSRLDLLERSGFDRLDTAAPFFRHCLGDPALRNEMAARLPRARLFALIRLLHPGSQDFIEAAAAAAFLSAASPEGPAVSTPSVRRALLEALALPGPFDEKNFLAALLRRLGPQDAHGDRIKRFRAFASSGRLVRVLDAIERDLALDLEARSTPLVRAALPGLAGPVSFRETIRFLLDTKPRQLHGFMERHLHRPGFIHMLAARLDPELLHCLLVLMRPRDAGKIKRTVGLLTPAVGKAAGNVQNPDAVIWAAVFSTLVEGESRHSLDEAFFVPRLLKAAADRLPGQPRAQAFYAGVAAALAEVPVRPSEKSARERIQAQIRERISELAPPAPDNQNQHPENLLLKNLLPKNLTPANQAPPVGPTRPADPERHIESFSIDNSGLVIASPYLPRLFTVLGLMNGPAFKDRASALKAVHLLQAMTDPDAPGKMQPLNLLLCGLPPGSRFGYAVKINTQDIETLESLITGMIQNWKALGHTSVQGFRESFLSRTGVLTLERNDSWRLRVDPRPFDMLLDAIPWSFTPIRHPWMDRVLHVNWR